MSEMRALRTEINTWKPQVDSRVDELEHAVLNLGEKVEKVLGIFPKPTDPVAALPQDVVTIAHPPSTNPSDILSSPTLKMPGSAHLEPTLHGAASGSFDHGDPMFHRGAGFGVVYTTTPDPAPVTGAKNSPTTPKQLPRSLALAGFPHCDPRVPCSAMPNFTFPSFDGTNPRHWVKSAETYFEVYAVDPSMWVKVASMHFVNSAALWLHTLPSDAANLSWKEFTSTVCLKFNRDEHNHLLRQFFHIKQNTSVSDYIEQFSEIIHQLLIHEPSLATSVITNRFVDGLKKEIRTVVMVHRPQELDTACSLALLQEEAMLDFSGKDTRRQDYSVFPKKFSAEAGKSNFTFSAKTGTATTTSTEDKEFMILVNSNLQKKGFPS